MCDRCDELETRVQQLEQQLENLTSRIEIRSDNHELADLWIDGLPVGKAITNNRDARMDLNDRVAALEAGEVDATAITTSDAALPIQRKLLERENGHEVKPKNLYRATYVWQDFHEHMVRDESGRYKLQTTQVKNILAKDDGLGMQNPNPNTVKRIMKMVARHSTPPEDVDVEMDPGHDDYPYLPQLLISFRDDTGENVLWANADQFDARMDEIASTAVDDAQTDAETQEDVDELRATASEQLDQLTEESAITED